MKRTILSKLVELPPIKRELTIKLEIGKEKGARKERKEKSFFPKGNGGFGVGS